MCLAGKLASDLDKRTGSNVRNKIDKNNDRIVNSSRQTSAEVLKQSKPKKPKSTLPSNPSLRINKDY